jgi:hypothetical protein
MNLQPELRFHSQASWTADGAFALTLPPTLIALEFCSQSKVKESRLRKIKSEGSVDWLTAVVPSFK